MVQRIQKRKYERKVDGQTEIKWEISRFPLFLQKGKEVWKRTKNKNTEKESKGIKENNGLK